MLIKADYFICLGFSPTAYSFNYLLNIKVSWISDECRVICKATYGGSSGLIAAAVSLDVYIGTKNGYDNADVIGFVTPVGGFGYLTAGDDNSVGGYRFNAGFAFGLGKYGRALSRFLDRIGLGWTKNSGVYVEAPGGVVEGIKGE